MALFTPYPEYYVHFWITNYEEIGIGSKKGNKNNLRLDIKSYKERLKEFGIVNLEQ